MANEISCHPETKPKDLKQKTKDPSLARLAQDDKKELGGRGGLDPVRYGDYEIAGKCVDF